MLMLAVQQGSRRAFEDLFAETSSNVYGILMHMLRSRPEADEVQQEVYIRVWTKCGLYSPELSRAEHWIAHMARHAAIDRLRAMGRRPAQVEYVDDQESGDRGPEDAAIAQNQIQLLTECLSRLDPERSVAVRRAYIEGASYDELAHQFGVPMNTMKSWLRRSLQRLRDCLQHREGDGND